MMNNQTENNSQKPQADPANSLFNCWDVRHSEHIEQQLSEAGQILANGGIVAFPTETVYGLGADARNTHAVASVFTAKGRPSDNPLIVHISHMDQLNGLVSEVRELEQTLIEHFWPGPLTLVMPVRADTVSPLVTAGLHTVAVRMPDHPVALALISASRCPLAAPSANRSGRPSPTTASHVIEDLSAVIDGVVDGGSAGIGVESTVIQVQADNTIMILRPGGVTEEQLSSFAPVTRDPALNHDSATALVPRSPGMKYTHYAPQGSMTIVIGSPDEVVNQYIEQEIRQAQARGEKTGVLVFDENPLHLADTLRLSLGSRDALAEAANRLYAALRTFDREGITFIMSQGCEQQGVGVAVMNRLSKAAGGQIIHL